MYKTITILFLMAFTAIPCFAVWDGEFTLIEPREIRNCLKDPKINNLLLSTDFIPYYLRGDFDGDNKPDYAIRMRSKVDGVVGIVICAGNGSIHLLGSGITGGENFSGMQKDSFITTNISTNWMVFTKEHVEDLEGAGGVNAPWPVPKPVGESIAIIYTDSIALIYWDGKQFKWAGADPDKM